MVLCVMEIHNYMKVQESKHLECLEHKEGKTTRLYQYAIDHKPGRISGQRLSGPHYKTFRE